MTSPHTMVLQQLESIDIFAEEETDVLGYFPLKNRSAYVNVDEGSSD